MKKLFHQIKCSILYHTINTLYRLLNWFERLADEAETNYLMGDKELMDAIAEADAELGKECDLEW